MLQRIESNVNELVLNIKLCKSDITTALNRYNDKEYNDTLLYTLILIKCEYVKKYLDELSINLYAIKGMI
jgi:hypothetical protein